MLLYHGGDRFDPSAAGYNFFGSYLSDLGRLHGFTGMPTLDTGVLYATSLTIMGLGTVAFFSVHRKLTSKSSSWLIKLCTILGIIAGLGYVAVALTPWDVLPNAHLVSVFVCFISFMLCCIAMNSLIINQPEYPNIYARIFLFFGLFIGLYIVFLIAGPTSDYETGRMIQATGQKILVYSQALFMTICCYGAWKQTKIYV